jgi:hypothetical protein
METQKPIESDGPQPNVTPQEQAMYDLVMTQARGILFGSKESDQSFKIVLEKLAGGRKEIGATIGHTAAMVMLSIKKGVEAKGREIPGDVLFHAGEEVVDDLIEIATAGKLMKESDTDRVKKEAVFEGLRIVGEADIEGGKVTPEKQAAAKAEMQGVLASAKKPQPKEPAGIINGAQEK